MSSEIYTALAGARSSWRQLESVAHNLANTDTTGFKAQRMSFRAVGPTADPLGEVYSTPDQITPLRTDGALENTDVPTDLALQGTGWFAVEAGGGERLTRDGRFQISQEGWLVTGSGHRVLSESGPIALEPGQPFAVSDTGELTSGEDYLGQLRLVDASVAPDGANLWRAEGPVVEAKPKVVQGALERSNTDPMRGMVELIEASRTFEAFQSAMRASDEADARLIRMGGG